MPSVIEARMNTADAINSCSPWNPWIRFVVSNQISTGMLKMRVSVMELGRFTTAVDIWFDEWPSVRHNPPSVMDYDPPRMRNAMQGTGQISQLQKSLRHFGTKNSPSPVLFATFAAGRTCREAFRVYHLVRGLMLPLTKRTYGT